jgi:hypothetical protein
MNRGLLFRDNAQLRGRGPSSWCSLFSVALAVAGCVNANVVRPLPEQGTITALVTEACSRKVAQLAAPYGPKGLASFVVQDAAPLPGNRYLISLLVSIDYPVEKRTALIHCVANEHGRIESIDDLPNGQ